MRLTKRGLQVLWSVKYLTDIGLPADGPHLTQLFWASTLDLEAAKVSPEGLHQSASVLANRGLLHKERPKGKPIHYTMSDAGSAELAAALDGKPRPL